ncbi:uncharacterized protein [Diadema setosum]|uniref:uncharacterized protein n=1 Tax=Diadema setosum TaxID=31175 RepID=UPI003B3A7934
MQDRWRTEIMDFRSRRHGRTHGPTPTSASNEGSGRPDTLASSLPFVRSSGTIKRARSATRGFRQNSKLPASDTVGVGGEVSHKESLIDRLLTKCHQPRLLSSVGVSDESFDLMGMCLTSEMVSRTSSQSSQPTSSQFGQPASSSSHGRTPLGILREHLPAPKQLCQRSSGKRKRTLSGFGQTETIQGHLLDLKRKVEHLNPIDKMGSMANERKRAEDLPASDSWSHQAPLTSQNLQVVPSESSPSDWMGLAFNGSFEHLYTPQASFSQSKKHVGSAQKPLWDLEIPEWIPPASRPHLDTNPWHHPMENEFHLEEEDTPHFQGPTQHQWLHQPLEDGMFFSDMPHSHQTSTLTSRPSSLSQAFHQPKHLQGGFCSTAQTGAHHEE